MLQCKPIPVLTLFVSLALLPALSAPAPQNQPRLLTGHVVNHQNQPAEKAVVYLKNTKTLAVRTYISEADGTFRFPGLTPNTEYEVYAELNNAHSDTKTLSAFDSRKQAVIDLKIHGK